MSSDKINVTGLQQWAPVCARSEHGNIYKPCATCVSATRCVISFSQKATITYLYITKLLVFSYIGDLVCCVYSAVRTELLYISQMHIKLIDCATDKAVMCRSFSAEAQVRFQVGTCDICGGQSGTGASFVSLPFQRCSAHCNVVLIGRAIGQRIEKVFNDDL
jgi:hypothetical protein